MAGRRHSLEESIAVFWGRTDRSSGCWIWQGTKTSGGYAQFKSVSVTGGKSVLAHRLAYKLAVGPIPDGLVLDHLCRNRACINPDHLDPVTQKENLHRGVSGSGKTHCLNGHPLSGDNVGFNKQTGWRRCKRCHADRMNQKRWRANDDPRAIRTSDSGVE